MMDHSQQAIKTPFGVTVFGSAISRIAPDIAVIKASLVRIQQRPSDAFSKARQGSRVVQDALLKANIGEFGTSRISLSATSGTFNESPRATRHGKGPRWLITNLWGRKRALVTREQKFLGYQAKVSFHVVLTDLDRVDEVLSLLYIAGANQVDDVSFQTTQLKEARAESRTRAVAAALEKANNYCAAAGVSRGAVLHIEDVNPDTLQPREFGHVRVEPQIDEADDANAFDPSLITVGAAVYVAYEILPKVV